jgi:pimeloyl-ACP methyl ester carboxylesterase
MSTPTDPNPSTTVTGAVPTPRAEADRTAIRPFEVRVPEEDLVSLRRRIAATRWPERETVTDVSQGVQLATMQALARYWCTEYDFRRFETRLNALPQFVTEIDGLDIHFIHVRSPHENALPLIITHGWPGSVIEMLNVIGPLTDPTAYGGNAADAFDVVVPSMPGYGFSGKPTETGWGPEHIADAWIELMRRLGYTQFVAQGGDWGAQITDVMGAKAPPGLLGIHSNMPGTVPPDVAATLAGDAAPSGLSAEEGRAWERLNFLYTKGIGYATEMALHPQTLYGLADSPVALAAWMIDHDLFSYEDIARAFDGNPVDNLTQDEVLDNITLTWPNQHRRVVGPPLLGEHARLLRRQGRPGAGRRERLPPRAVSGTAQLDRAGLPPPHLLPRSRQRQPLRGLAGAGPLHHGTPRGVPAAALTKARNASWTRQGRFSPRSAVPVAHPGARPPRAGCRPWTGPPGGSTRRR